MSLKGRTVVVTGRARGLGLTFAFAVTKGSRSVSGPITFLSS